MWKKRAFDLVLTIPLSIILSLVLLMVAVLIRILLGAPLLFRQQRPGLHGQPFTILKFRTMTGARDAQGRLLSDADRLTLLGRFVASTSLDELPELFDALKGQMALIGRQLGAVGSDQWTKTRWPRSSGLITEVW